MRKRLMILALVLIAVLMTCTLAACSGGGGRCSGGHTWDEGTVKEAATCTESGTLINKCTVCGIKREVAIEALGHDLQTIPGTVVEPTCEEDGYAGKKACVREGCEYVLDTGTIIPAIGHAYGDWTSNGDGTHKRVCSNDSNHVESGNCSGGTADCGHKAVCDVCGGEYGDFASSHVFDKQVTTDDYKATDATCEAKATYYYSCQCGEKGTETFEYGDYLDHVFDREVAEAEYLVSVATCTSPAIYNKSCACGLEGTETFESGDALGHTMTHHAAVDATCVSKGNVEYWTCSTCALNYDSATGGNVIDDVTTPTNLTNHVHTEITAPAVDPNCENTGLTEEISCADCGIVLQERESIPALGHKGGTATCKDKAVCEVCGEAYGELVSHTPGEIKVENNVAPSCTAEGSYDNVVYCSVCDHELSRETITTDKVAHTGGTATCVEQATCSVCGEKYGDLADHSWDEGVVTTPATCTTEGVKTFTCTVDNCGETRTETIEKSAHNFVDNVCEYCQATVSYVDKTIVFTFGENGNAEHKDGSTDKATYTETKDGYTLSISGGSKMYPGSFDAKGNSALKLGTSSVVGSFEFTVPADVTEVVIYVAQYKEKTTKISVNGVAYTITTASTDGAYTEIKVDTTVNKKVSFTTVSGGYRCMINTIEFKVSAENICNHENRKVNEVVAPTCTVAGHTTFVCLDCDHVFDANFVDATGHTLVSIPAVAPSCENTGLTEGEKCSVCDHVTIERTIVDMLPCVDADNDECCDNCHKPMCEHIYGDWTYLSADTHNRICTLCGKEEIAGHDYKVTSHVDATCEEAGSTTYACADCGHEYTETHVALGHDESTHDAKAPTCSAVGWEAYVTCSRCDYTTYVELPLDAEAHKWDEGEVKTPATCTEAGERLHTCEHNAEHTKVEVISATGHAPVKNVCSCGYEYSDDEIIALAEALAKGTALKGTYRLTGVITSVDTEFSTQYNNVTVTISVDSTEKDFTIQCFRMKGEGAEVIGVGDTITVSGEIKNYNGTIQFNTGCALESYVPAEFKVYFEVLGKGTVSGIPAGILARGDEVTFTVTPDTANKYEIDRVTINGSTLNGTDGVYTFTVSANTTVNVSFKKEGQESSITNASVSTVIGDYATANGWEDATRYDTVVMDENITVTALYTTGTYKNTGKYYNNGKNWRIYQNEKPEITISGGANVTIVSVMITYTVSNTGVMTCGGLQVKSGTLYSVNGESVVFSVGNTGTATNGQIRITQIDVNYAVESASGTACAHENWSDYVVTTPATCSERGVETATCLNAECGETKTRQIPVDPTLHVYNETITTPATCTQPGSKTLTCECGDTKTEEIPATGHNYNSVVTAPTCTADGYTTHTCSVCGDTYKDNETSATGHTEETIPAVAPGCESEGLTEGKKCSVCGEILTAQQTISATGHAEVVDKAVEATCTTAGKTEGKHCSVCNEVLVAQTVVPATGHSGKAPAKENIVDATCEEDGSYEMNVYCATCGEMLSSQKYTTDKLGHDYVSTVTKDPTCTETGVRTYTCTHDNSHTYTEVIEKLSHTPAAAVEENREEATCTKEGSYDSVVKCSVCGEELSREAKTIDKIAHSSVEIPAVAPTCTEKGKTAGAKCSVCGEILTSPTDVDALDHDYKSTVTEPTCTEKGYTTHDCSRCDSSYVDTYVDAIDHAYVGEVTTPATCEGKGLMTYTCQNDNSHTYTEEIKATGHTWDVGTETTAATCEADGVMTYTCTVENCGAEKTETIVKLGHKDEDSNNVCDRCEESLCEEHNAGDKVVENNVPATCTVNGSYDEVVYCSVCKFELSRETKVNVAPGHTEGEVVVENNVDPTCTTAGSYDNVVYCSVCDVELSRNKVTVDALGHSYGNLQVTSATCEEAGYITITCRTCEKVFNSKVDKEAQDYLVENPYFNLDPKGHTIVVDEAVAPTCTTTGLTEGSHCSECGKVFVAQSEVATLVHDLVTAYEVVVVEEVNTLHKVTKCDREGCEHIAENVTVDTTNSVAVANETDLRTVLENGFNATLTSDITLEVGSIEIAGTTATVDLNGHNITVTGEKDGVCEAFYVQAGGNLTINGNGTILAKDMGAEHVITLSAVDGAVVRINGGDFVSEGSTAVYATRGAVVNIYGGTYSAVAYQGQMYTIDVNEAEAVLGVINVYGGTFHNFDPANHTNDGTYTNKVMDGHHSIKDGDNYVVSAHIAGATVKENVVNATCTNTGSHDDVVYCTVCEAELSRTTVTDAVIAHTEVVDAAVQATCTTAGKTEGKHCSVCGTVTKAQETIDALGHTGGTATCTEKATCTVCGEAYGEFAAHTEETLPAIDATCTETGLEEGSKCSVCGKVLVEQVEIPALGHDEVEHEAQAPTCTEAGWEAYVTCSRCDYTTYKEISATGHNEVEIPAVDATCTATGLTAGKKCSVCGTVTKAQEEIALKAHTYVEDVGICSVCGANESIKITLDFTKQGYNNQQEVSSLEVDDVVVEFNKGTNSNTPKYFTTGAAIRVYGGGYFVVSAEVAIAKIELTFGTGDGNNDVSVDVGSFDVDSNIWTGSSQSVKFSIGGTSGHRRIASITVYCSPVKACETCTESQFDHNETYHWYVCTKCSFKHSLEAHTFDKMVATDDYKATDATCTAKATYYYSCECGLKGTETFESGELLEHKYDQKVADEKYFANKATCLTPATYYMSCVCGEKGTDTFEHGTVVDHEDDGEGNCVYCGNSMCEHEMPDDWTIRSQATCTTAGEQRKECVKGCGYYETETIAALGHDFGELIAKVEATCLDEGKKAHYECSRCQSLFDENKNATAEEDLVIAKTDHNLVDNICSVCKWTSIDETIDLDETYEKGVAPSKHDGNNVTLAFNTNDGQYTPQADDSYFKLYAKNSIIISAVEGKITKVIITYSGSYTGTFSLEGYALNGSTGTWIGAAYSIEFRNSSGSQARITSIQIITEYYVCEHVPTGDAIEVKAATCTEDGYEKYMCEKCSQVYVETVLEATGHTYVDQVTAPTCTAKGYTTHTCSTCGHNYKDSEVDMIDHTYVDGVCSCGAKEPSGDEPTYIEATYTYTFTEKQFSANGTMDLNGVNWTLAGDGDYWGYEATRGQQLGSSKAPYKSLTLTSGKFTRVKKIVINTSGGSSINGTFTVTVGGTQVGSSTELTTTATSYTFNPDLLSGPVVFSYTQTSSKAIYIKSITIVHEVEQN